jgi:hypothetical protein
VSHAAQNYPSMTLAGFGIIACRRAITSPVY